IWLVPSTGTGLPATITLSGAGFIKDTIISTNTIKIGDGFATYTLTQHPMAIIDADGSFTLQLIIPFLPGGMHDVQIKADSRVYTFVDRYIVSGRITLNPFGGSGQVGNKTLITGTGFTGSSSLKLITFGPTPITQSEPSPILISEQGEFSATLTLPYFSTKQTFTVTAMDMTGIFATAIYYVNRAPVLIYPYVSPVSGEMFVTNFTFSVQYRDYDGDEPLSGYPKVLLILDEKVMQELELTYFSDYIPQGAFYNGSTTIYEPGIYTFRVVAFDKYGVPSVNEVTGGDINVTAGVPPVLSWVGTESGFENDGVSEDEGTSGTTLFTYKVRYRDFWNKPPMEGYPKLSLYIGELSVGS
ncbi:MAG: hypothetical protein AAB296_00120, partial [Candidatus Desantisbacteria bacterium]